MEIMAWVRSTLADSKFPEFFQVERPFQACRISTPDTSGTFTHQHANERLQSQEVAVYCPWAPPQVRVKSGGVNAQHLVSRGSPAVLTHLPPQMVLPQPAFERFPLT